LEAKTVNVTGNYLGARDVGRKFYIGGRGPKASAFYISLIGNPSLQGAAVQAQLYSKTDKKVALCRFQLLLQPILYNINSILTLVRFHPE